MGLKIWFKKISGKQGNYDKKYTNIKLNSDYNLPLNKILKLYYMTKVIRSLF